MNQGHLEGQTARLTNRFIIGEKGEGRFRKTPGFLPSNPGRLLVLLAELIVTADN